MPTATELLRHDHEAITKMLDAAEVVAQRLDKGEPVREEVLQNLLEFFRLFADKCHHGKEEELLFPLLEKKGVPVNGGPIGVMLNEHEQGRALIKEMADVYGGNLYWGEDLMEIPLAGPAATGHRG